MTKEIPIIRKFYPGEKEALAKLLMRITEDESFYISKKNEETVEEKMIENPEESKQDL